MKLTVTPKDRTLKHHLWKFVGLSTLSSHDKESGVRTCGALAALSEKYVPGVSINKERHIFENVLTTVTSG